MRKTSLLLAGFLVMALMSFSAPKMASAQISIGIGGKGLGVNIGRPAVRGPVFHPGRGYLYRGGYYPFHHNGAYYRYRHNGIYYNHRYNGNYWRYHRNGRYYNYRSKGRYYAYRERRCRTKSSGKKVCWWHYY